MEHTVPFVDEMAGMKRPTGHRKQIWHYHDPTIRAAFTNRLSPAIIPTTLLDKPAVAPGGSDGSVGSAGSEVAND